MARPIDEMHAELREKIGEDQTALGHERSSIPPAWIPGFREDCRSQAHFRWPWFEGIGWSGEVNFAAFRRRPFDWRIDL